MKVWTPREHRLLLRAWEEVPAIAGEGDRPHCVRIHARFAELRGGDTERSESAVYGKRSALLYNYHFIAKYEKNREPDDPSWFELRPRGREELFNASAVDQKYMNLDALTYSTIKQILAQSPVQPHRAVKQKRQASPPSVASRSISLEWTRGELTSLVRAWRDETKDTRSHAGSKLRSNHNRRIYERFAIACGGTATRSPGAVTTKRQDLVCSYEFIARFNAKQQQNKNATWFMMSKVEKLAVLRGVQRSGHISDIPEDIFEMVGQVIEGSRDSASDVGSGSDDEDAVDDSELASPRPPSDPVARKKQKVSAEATARSSGERFVSKSALHLSREPRRNASNIRHQMLEMAEALSEQSHHLCRLARKMESANEAEAESTRAPTDFKGRHVNFVVNNETGRGSSDRRREAPAQTKAKSSLEDVAARLQNQGGGHGESWEA